MRISDWSSDVCSSDLLDVEQDVVGLDQVVDRIGQLAATPVLETVDLALAALDQRLVALDHGGHLLALVRMAQEHDFVMTRSEERRVGKECVSTCRSRWSPDH